MVAAAKTDEVFGGVALSDADARLVDDLLRTIVRDRGHLKTKDLLKEVIDRSRPESSPTHHLFEWDPVKGHALYLLERARRLVMEVRVVFVEAPKADPVRAWPVRVKDGARGPMPMRQVLGDKEQAEVLIEEALADLERWRRRYEHLKKLAPVIQAIDRVKKEKK